MRAPRGDIPGGAFLISGQGVTRREDRIAGAMDAEGEAETPGLELIRVKQELISAMDEKEAFLYEKIQA